MDVARHRRRYPSTPAVVGSADTAKFAEVPGDYTRIAVGAPVSGWLSYASAYSAAVDFTPDAPTRADETLLLYFTSIMAARSIVVVGLGAVTQDEVTAAAAVAPGTPLLQVDTDAVAERVAAIRRVASVRVQRQYPSTLRVTVIEDVVTTGGDSLRTVEVLRNAQLEVIHLVVVLDRDEGGAENIGQAGVPYSPLFRVSDLTLD